MGIMRSTVCLVVAFQTQNSRDELIRVTLDMPKDLIVWIDQLKVELGLRSRASVVVQLMQELREEA